MKISFCFGENKKKCNGCENIKEWMFGLSVAESVPESCNLINIACCY